MGIKLRWISCNLAPWDPLGIRQLRAVNAVGARGAEVDPKETIVLASPLWTCFKV